MKRQAPQPDRMSAEQAPPLDAETLAQLRELEVLDEVAEAYLGDAAPRIAAIGAAIAGGDARALRETAHALKGSSGTVGARQLAALCGEIERCAQRGALVEAAALHARATRELARVEDALRAARGS